MTVPLKADVTAADRLLKAAVRRAVEMIADGCRIELVDGRGKVIRTAMGYDEPAVVALLANATHAADLLLADDERPAKKAAKRAPRKAGS